MTYRYRELLIFFGGIGTGIGKILYRKKSRNRYRSNLVSEKSLGTGIGKIWYRKKYRYRYRKYLVPEKSIGIGIVQHFGYRHTLIPMDVFQLFIYWQIPPYLGYSLLKRVQQAVV